MTSTPQPQPQPSLTPTARRVPVGRTPAAGALARRRRALVRLAERRGEVRIAVCEAGGVNPAACGVIDLLDGLNEVGLLRYGGLQRAGSTLEIVYRPA